MDWRDRRYFIVSFGPCPNKYIPILASNKNLKLTPPTYPLMPSPANEIVRYWMFSTFPDEKRTRGYYQTLISCRKEYADSLISQLEEIKKDILSYVGKRMYEEVLPKWSIRG